MQLEFVRFFFLIRNWIITDLPGQQTRTTTLITASLSTNSIPFSLSLSEMFLFFYYYFNLSLALCLSLGNIHQLKQNFKSSINHSYTSPHLHAYMCVYTKSEYLSLTHTIQETHTGVQSHTGTHSHSKIPLNTF